MILAKTAKIAKEEILVGSESLCGLAGFAVLARVTSSLQIAVLKYGRSGTNSNRSAPRRHSAGARDPRITSAAL